MRDSETAPSSVGSTSSSETTTPDVSVIIVSYNSSGVLAECLGSLGDPRIEVILVDNASVDESPEIAAEILPELVVIRNEENFGFAKAVNVGASRSTGDFLLLLNPDALISADDILSLASYMRTHPDVGALAPLLDHPSGRLAIREGGQAPTVWRVFTHYSNLSRFAGRFPQLKGLYLLDKDVGSDDVDVDWISGASLMVPRALFEEMNGLSERWFMYAEDLELCLRIKRLQRRVVITPSIRAVHALGRSTDAPPSTNPAWVVNMFDLYRTSISKSPLHHLVWKTTMAAGLLSRSLGYRVRAVSDHRSRSMWVLEARRFSGFARAVATAGRSTEAGSDDNR